MLLHLVGIFLRCLSRNWSLRYLDLAPHTANPSSKRKKFLVTCPRLKFTQNSHAGDVEAPKRKPASAPRDSGAFANPKNFASGFGGVVLVAYFAALCNLQFTAAHYALISSATSVVGRLLTGTTAGAMVESMGFFNYYLLTTVIALPGIILFWMMMRSGLIDSSIGTAAAASERA